jgi:hypothetical protein
MSDVSPVNEATVDTDREPQFIDITPTWTEVVPLLVAGLQQHRSSYSAMVAELYTMAALADAANKWLPRLIAQGDVLAAGAKVAAHRHWVSVRSEYEDDRIAMSKRLKSAAKEGK